MEPVRPVRHTDQGEALTELYSALLVLKERCDWLTARIEAKQSIGWDTTWDTRERDALALVISQSWTTTFFRETVSA